MLITSAMVTAKTLQQLFNQALTTGEYLVNLKNTDVTPVFKKKNQLNKEKTDLSVFHLLSQKYLKN